MSKRHREALAHLIYGINHGGGFVLLTGEVGTGKTTISRCLLKQLPKNTDIAYILNPSLSAIELLASLCDELGVTQVEDKNSLKALSDALHKFLLQNHAKGRNTVLIIDEAQHLEIKVMEQVRLLTNLETDEKKLLQIIFIGQPELNDVLAKKELRQLAQRVTARFHINPLTLQETDAYIRHRLMVSGMSANQTLFTPAAVREVFRATGGIPRLINVTCDRALLGAYTNNLEKVDLDLAQDATSEIAGAVAARQLPPNLPYYLAGGLSVFIVIAVLLILFDRNPEPPSNTAANTVIAVETKPQPIERERAPLISSADETTSHAINNFTFNSDQDAVNELQVALSIYDKPLTPACEKLTNFGVHCEIKSSRSWQELQEYNRPAILELDVNGERTFVAMRFLNDNEATLIAGQQTGSWSLFELGRFWTGNFTILWQPPMHYREMTQVGDTSPFVTWVANSFAMIDGQQDALTHNRFNDALAQRVAMFQEENGLDADGIVGIKTVLRLNDYLDKDFSLQPNRKAN
ncbi:AAA family ATPase [Marinibactrum halimedae]|nr:AAA family ATPase [Marinibactrum halimedae]